MKLTLAAARRALRAEADPRKAETARGFFKDTRGDVFLGVPAPKIRKITKLHGALALPDVARLMRSKVHEERSLAHAVLRLKFDRGDAAARKAVFDLYMKNRGAIRQWDGVDDSAPYIVGPHLMETSRALLYKLVKSKSLWDRRIAMVATWPMIRAGEVDDALKLAAQLLADAEDLMHKASGWMLREVGKRDLAALKAFIRKHHARMPRTMLRYAIERFPPAERLRFLKGRF